MAVVVTVSAGAVLSMVVDVEGLPCAARGVICAASAEAVLAADFLAVVVVALLNVAMAVLRAAYLPVAVAMAPFLVPTIAATYLLVTVNLLAATYLSVTVAVLATTSLPVTVVASALSLVPVAVAVLAVVHFGVAVRFPMTMVVAMAMTAYMIVILVTHSLLTLLTPAGTARIPRRFHRLTQPRPPTPTSTSHLPPPSLSP